VNDQAERQELREAIDKGHFVRAAHLAESVGLPQEELNDIRARAMWEIAAVNRNPPGTKRLAQEYGLSKKKLKEFLEERAETKRREGDAKALEPCYDISTGTYLNFEEWMSSLLKKYDKISVP
jgi:hypothetical protein